MDVISERRKEIINTARKLFSEKGYIKASVQDIAKECNVSKATIYKCFNSKEEILIEIVESFHTNMKNVFEKIDLNKDLTPIERYEEKIYEIFNNFVTRRETSVILFKNEWMLDEETKKNILLDNKRGMVKDFRYILIDAFGDDIDLISWDMTICLKGVILEFINAFVIKRLGIIDYRQLSRFIVDITKEMIEVHKRYDSFLSIDLIRRVNGNIELINEESYLKKEWKDRISKIRALAKTSKTIINRKGILEAIDLLEMEEAKENRSSVIIEALIGYIEENVELKGHAYYLKNIWNGLKSKGEN
ncbi:TetR/AcrR family transcriptional regulator [Clostridium sp.]|uniref:TetR/AcrR family transcriptional regulator n=1 Tax=Clostridium sp. TaxID=1506 RepID=UPI002FC59109